MAQQYPNALAVSRKLLRALILLNLVLGLLILALLAVSLLAEGPVMNALGVRDTAGREALIIGMRVVAILGLFAVPLAHVVLTRLKAIVDTVTVGDPFVAENAARLQTIAWALLGLELLHLVIGAVARLSSSDAQALYIDWNLSVTRWLAVLLCFVLARVFRQGSQMRDELEGTV